MRISDWSSHVRSSDRVPLRDDHANGLGRAGARWNDVLENAAATTPILLARAVDGFLRRGGRVHRGHQATLDTPLVVQHLGQRREAIGRARSVDRKSVV